MTMIINNQEVEKVLTMADTIAALEKSYLQLAAGEAVCRPRIDIRIPTSDPARNYQWGTMEGGSTAGYFAIRMLSGDDLLRLCIVDDCNFYDIALFGDFPGRCGDFGAERGERFARFVAQIVNRKLEAGFGDVRRHRLPHRAQTYKTNLGLH